MEYGNEQEPSARVFLEWTESNENVAPPSIGTENNSLPGSLISSESTLRRSWIPNSGQSSSVPLYYQSSVWPGSQTTTVDTFIQSFTQRLQVSEAVPVNSMYTCSPLYYDSCSSNLLPCMANYRAITQYYNSRRVDCNTMYVPLANRPVYQTPTLLPLTNMPQIRYLLPQGTPQVVAQDQVPHNPSDTNCIKHKRRNVYPTWKYFNPQVQKQTLMAMKMDMAQKQESPKSVNHVEQNIDNSTEVQQHKWPHCWSNVISTSNFVNSLLKNTPSVGSIASNTTDSDISFTTAEEAECDKLNQHEYLNENKWIMRYLDRYYDYINPYCCEFCAISLRRNNNSALELSEQKLLLHFLRLNPHELTDGIKSILTWPLDKLTNNMNELDGISSFYADEHKRDVKELFPTMEPNNENINKDVPLGHTCFMTGCSCQYIAQEVTTLAVDQAANVDSKSNATFEEIMKLSESNYQSYRYKQNMTYDTQSEEHVRNRMAEFVCIGPLNNNWYMELLEGFWSRERPRMAYTQNFVYPHSGEGDKNMYYPCEPISQEKLQEIMKRRAQLKPRNRI